MVVMPRRQTLALELTPAEFRMLEQLSSTLGVSPQDALRRLLREAYQRRLQLLESRAGFGFLDLIPEPSRVAQSRGKSRSARPAPRKTTAKKSAAKKSAAKKRAVPAKRATRAKPKASTRPRKKA